MNTITMTIGEAILMMLGGFSLGVVVTALAWGLSRMDIQTQDDRETICKR